MEVLVDASFAERAKALVDRVGVAEKALADWALKQWVQRLLLHCLDMRREQFLHGSAICTGRQLLAR